MEDGADQTVFHGYQEDLGSELDLWIQFKNHLCNDADIWKVVDDQKLWLTWMEVHDLSYN